MTPTRFVLTYRGQGSMPPADVALLSDKTAVLDQSRTGLLVADTAYHLRHLLHRLPNWSYRPERWYQPFSATS